MDCGLQAEVGSPAHLAEVFGRVCRDRVPFGGTFDLTYRCNFRCVHCYAGHLAGQTPLQAAEIETEKVFGLLSAAADAGCLLLLLSGGEPLLREDFTEIYAHARRLGMIVTVFTNASLVAQTHLDVFAEYPPHMVEVSVYGATEAVYERVTGVPGSFRRSQRGIERLLDGGVRVGLKTMILRENADEIAGIEAFAQSLGLPFRLDPMVTPRLDGDPKPLSQRVEPQRAVDIEMSTGERRSEVARFLERQKAAIGPDPAPVSRLYRCGAGIASFHIDSRGYMRPCLMSVPIAYNTATLGFARAWKAVTVAIDQARWEGTGGCVDCPTILLCDYCPGLFELEQASPSQPPEYVCRLGESRQRAVGEVRPEVVHVGAG
jgi:MoaA/NifB/PqqE/SkfB family radical SAM enzyme